MAYWLFKEEPSNYSFDDLRTDKKTTWDGVKNNAALKHLRAVKKGDRVFFYHTGKEKSVVGIMEVTRAAYPDPALDDEKRVIVDVKPIKKLKRPVALSEIKADETFADFALVRISRLSVMPVTSKLWKKIEAMSKTPLD